VAGEAPWGGVKRSGVGRELGERGLYNYLEPKQVTVTVTVTVEPKQVTVTVTVTVTVGASDLIVSDTSAGDHVCRRRAARMVHSPAAARQAVSRRTGMGGPRRMPRPAASTFDRVEPYAWP